MMADPKASSLVTSFAMKWLNIADLDAVKPDPIVVPGLQRSTSARFFDGGPGFPEQHSSGRSKRCGSADCRLHVPERAAGAPLRDFRSCWPAIPQGHVDRERTLGLAGQRRGAAANFLWRPHVSRFARSVGARQADGHAAVAAAAERRNRISIRKPGEKPKTVRARLEQHREQRVCMQCHGVIDPSGLPLENFDAIGRWRTTDRQADNAVDRRTLGAAEWRRDRRSGGTVGPVGQPSGNVRAGPDGKADDVRAQSGARVFRYASGARGCSCGSEGQLQVFFNRSGYRQHRAFRKQGAPSESQTA